MGQPVLGPAPLARPDPDARPELAHARGEITAAQVASGAGDAYLAALNEAIHGYGSLVYVRLFPEMDGSWNAHCAFNDDGSRRSPAHSTANFRRAFARISLLLHGGTKRALEALSKAYANKPFSIAEWGLEGVEDPDFVRRLADFVRSHGRTEAVVLFSPLGPYDLRTKPRSLAAYRAQIVPLGRTA